MNATPSSTSQSSSLNRRRLLGSGLAVVSLPFAWEAIKWLLKQLHPGDGEEKASIDSCHCERVKLMFEGFRMSKLPTGRSDLPSRLKLVDPYGNEREFSDTFILDDRRFHAGLERFTEMGYHVRYDQARQTAMMRYRDEGCSIVFSAKTRQVVAYWHENPHSFELWWRDWSGQAQRVTGKPNIKYDWARCNVILKRENGTVALQIPFRVLAGAARAWPKEDVRFLGGRDLRSPARDSLVTIEVPDDLQDVYQRPGSFEDDWQATPEIQARLGLF